MSKRILKTDSDSKQKTYQLANIASELSDLNNNIINLTKNLTHKDFISTDVVESKIENYSLKTRNKILKLSNIMLGIIAIILLGCIAFL